MMCAAGPSLVAIGAKGLPLHRDLDVGDRRRELGRARDWDAGAARAILDAHLEALLGDEGHLRPPWGVLSETSRLPAH